MRLTYDFYNRHVVDVAKDLLGKTLVFGNHQGVIIETEAYRGYDDEASHAFRGCTNRSSIMFGPPGHTYIYLIYGMYYCLNFVTEEPGQASAVLIRGLKLPEINLNGPGKICRYLGINKIYNDLDLVHSNQMYVTHHEKEKAPLYLETPRIGIKKATDKHWRFIVI